MINLSALQRKPLRVEPATSNLSAEDFEKRHNFNESKTEPAIRSSDTGQQTPCGDSCQLTTTWMCNVRL